MKIHDDHLYHGAALTQIAEHPLFIAINALKVGGKRFVSHTASTMTFPFISSTQLGPRLGFRSTFSPSKQITSKSFPKSSTTLRRHSLLWYVSKTERFAAFRTPNCSSSSRGVKRLLAARRTPTPSSLRYPRVKDFEHMSMLLGRRKLFWAMSSSSVAMHFRRASLANPAVRTDAAR